MVIFVILSRFLLLRTVFCCSVLFLLLLTAFYKFVRTVSMAVVVAPYCFWMLCRAFHCSVLLFMPCTAFYCSVPLLMLLTFFYCSVLVYFFGILCTLPDSNKLRFKLFEMAPRNPQSRRNYCWRPVSAKRIFVIILWDSMGAIRKDHYNYFVSMGRCIAQSLTRWRAQIDSW